MHGLLYQAHAQTGRGGGEKEESGKEGGQGGRGTGGLAVLAQPSWGAGKLWRRWHCTACAPRHIAMALLHTA
eukprot:254928-Chlamydomonas_euryale.AAC.2